MTNYLAVLARSLVLVALCVAIGACHGRRVNTTRDQVESRIRSSIPSGSDVAHALATLDSMGVEHSEYDPATRTVDGIIRRTAESFLVEDAVQMRFTFDENNRLARISFDEVATGP